MAQNCLVNQVQCKNHFIEQVTGYTSILKFNLHVISHVSGTRSPEDYTAQEIEYLGKVEWLWQQLSPSQKYKIVYSVTDGALRQGSDKHCFIAEAISTNKVKTSVSNYSLFYKIMQLVNTVFYDGPSYDFLLDKKISSDDRKKLNDIYYARIGDKEYQYQKATELVRAYVTHLLITIK